MHPRDLSISDFTYVLPSERIAQQPLQQRDHSKLLIYDDGMIREDIFSNLGNHLPENAALVFNDTKVIHARIIFKNEHDAAIEVFLLDPVEPYHEMQLAIFQHSECTWRCLVGNVKKWREDFLSRKIKIGNEVGMVEVRLKGKIENDFLVHFSWMPKTFSFAKILEAVGYVPLPPYIKRKAAIEDEDRYQTLYAFQDGSVAAPTAGLHFTESLFEKLQQKKIHPLFVTLHVSAGTFKPVKVPLMKDHPMHAEQFVVRRQTIEELIRRKDHPVISVGTTSLRTLESLFWIGLKLMNDGRKSTESLKHSEIFVDQWEPYEKMYEATISVSESLQAILYYMEKKKLNQLVGETKLIIAPGYSFKIANGLITNFHLPQSTLLLLVSAFIGDDWIKVYDHATQHDFRFLSYGDGSLLWRK